LIQGWPKGHETLLGTVNEQTRLDMGCDSAGAIVKKLYPVFRVLLQLLMCGPLLAVFPLAVFVGLGAIFFALTGESHGLSKDIGYGFGWLGLLGLVTTILVPCSFFKKRKWARVSATVLIAFGFLATAAILLEPLTSHEPSMAQPWWVAWLLGGPVIVGAWNLSRLYR
jgi:hypothetical protein